MTFCIHITANLFAGVIVCHQAVLKDQRGAPSKRKRTPFPLRIVLDRPSSCAVVYHATMELNVRRGVPTPDGHSGSLSRGSIVDQGRVVHPA